MSGLELVRSIIANNPDLNCRIAAERIEPEMSFRRDLGMDSLGLMSLLYELQESHSTLDEKDLAGWFTVADCLRAMERGK